MEEKFILPDGLKFAWGVRRRVDFLFEALYVLIIYYYRKILVYLHSNT